MTEAPTGAPAHPGAAGAGAAEGSTRPGDVPAEERGVLDVRTKAVQHLVEAAAHGVPGTTSTRAGLGSRLPGQLVAGALGASYPSASVQMHGDHARVVLDVACVWPGPIAEVARRVRDEVIATVTRLSGVTISDVDVTVHPVTTSTTGRRAV